MNPAIKLQVARGDRCNLAPIRALRLLLLGQPGQLSGSLPSDEAPTSWHITAWADSRLVAASLLARECAPFDKAVTWRLRAMAVAPSFRGDGIGTILVQERLLMCGDQDAWSEVRTGASLAAHVKAGAIVMPEPTHSPHSWHPGPMVQVLHKSGRRSWASQLPNRSRFA